MVCFKGERNKKIEISAWEVDKERFDIFLVKPTDIMDDRFREEQARIAEWSVDDFEETYTFDRIDRLCLVVSNKNATLKDKIVKLRLSWVIHGVDHSPFRKSKDKMSTQKGTAKSTILWKIGFTSIIIIPSVVAVIVLSLTGDFLLPGIIISVAYPILGIISRLYNKELRTKLGLRD